MYKYCSDQLIRTYIPEIEIERILNHYHSQECGGHLGFSKTVAKVLQCGFYWSLLFRDAQNFVNACD